MFHEWFKFNSRQRSTLPAGRPTSTIDAERLNCCVRDGNRWFPLAIITEKLLCDCLGPLPVPTGNSFGFCLPGASASGCPTPWVVPSRHHHQETLLRCKIREAGGGNDRSFCLPIFSPFLAPWKLHRKFCLSFDYLDCDA
jgi:hypothetical protein